MQVFQSHISLLNGLSIKSCPSLPEPFTWLKANLVLVSPDLLSITKPDEELCQYSVIRADAAEGTSLHCSSATFRLSNRITSSSHGKDLPSKYARNIPPPLPFFLRAAADLGAIALALPADYWHFKHLLLGRGRQGAEQSATSCPSALISPLHSVDKSLLATIRN